MTRWRAPLAAAAALASGLLGILPAVDEPRAAPASVGADGRVSVAVVAPITVPVGTPGLLTAAQLTRFTGPGGLLTQELDSVTSPLAQSVALAVDPRIIASIRVLGTDAPDSARAWLDRLAAAPNETFPLLYADADPVLAGQAGLGAELSPLDFSYAIDPGDFSAPAPTPSPSVTTTPDPADPPPLPQSTDEVLSWDWRYDDIVWPAADTVAEADLPRLAASYGTALLSDSNVTGPAGHVTLGTEGATLGGLVIDSELSSAASAVADADSPSAELSLAGLESATRAVAADARGAVRVVALPRSAPASLRFLPAALSAMQSAGATAVPLSTALDTDAADATLVDRSEPEDRLARIPGILEAVAADDAFSSVAVQPVAIQGPRRLELLALLSTGWLDDGDWPSAVTRFLERSTDLRAGVSLVVLDDPVRFIGANVPFPVTVRNRLDTPVRVYAVVRSLRPALSIPADRRRVAITVQPDSTSTVRVPTQSVANGRVAVEVNLLSTSGVSVGQPNTIAVDVQAGWETVGTLVAVVLVLGVFGFGVTRNILRRRADRRRTAPTTGPPDGPGADARG